MPNPNNSTNPTQAPLPPQPPLHSPPPIYTPYYCEENTHNLLRALESGAYTRSRPLRSYAVFVSNLDKRCLLFHQRASKQGAEYGSYVIWDYHVLVVAVMEVGKGRTESVVFDRDSLLGPAVPLRDYIKHTFQFDAAEDDDGVDLDLRSRFRVVPSDVFFANFASDRSHMLLPPHPLATAASPPTLRYHAPPPTYPALVGDAAKARGETNNLFSHFLDMRLRSETAGSPQPYPDEALFGAVLSGAEELLVREW